MLFSQDSLEGKTQIAQKAVEDLDNINAIRALTMIQRGPSDTRGRTLKASRATEEEGEVTNEEKDTKTEAYVEVDSTILDRETSEIMIANPIIAEQRNEPRTN